MPSLLTEFQTTDIPATYQRFAEIVGARIWTHRVAQMKAEIRSNRFLEAYLYGESEIACVFRTIGATHSNRRPPAIPIQTRHVIQPKAATKS